MSNSNFSKEAEIVYTFATSQEAWHFMRECERKGIVAGYPSLEAPYTVRTLPGYYRKIQEGR